MLDAHCNRCKEALAQTVIHLHCGCVMPNHVSTTICGVTPTGAKQPGWVLAQCPCPRQQPPQGWQHRRELEASAAILHRSVVHHWQGQDHLNSLASIECNVSLFICLINIKELEKVMLHKGDDPPSRCNWCLCSCLLMSRS